MIIRPPEKTPLLKQLEVLLPRIDRSNPNFEKLDNLLGRETAGYFGETSLHYYFSLTDSEEALLLYGLRLQGKDNAFQIDALLLTGSVCFIVEAKNLKGTISFNQNDQMIRTLDQITETFPNPEIQAAVQRWQLSDFLAKHGFPAIPIHPVVTFTHPRVILQSDQKYDDILTNERLPSRINAIKSAHAKVVYQKQQLYKLAHFLNEKHQANHYFVIQRYQIAYHHIRRGVWCPSCQFNGKRIIMHRIKRYWYCPACREKNNTAHIQALCEYALLFGTSITNKQARLFLGIESNSTAKRILINIGLETSGETKGRIYYLDKLLEQNYKRRNDR
ncbi:nuclease-related domain-containing protein [Paraliobacillus sediminis]|uniref:nuclease-related domain-containing protein n=1 Tax=Paraliobacillus sediminis TaxID=1885916 RepID=UPI0013C2A75F|nr:nuclease-related domain-containing protein [Paraliobacillus sediminis]